MNSQIYISIDVETNGPVPGLFSMLSLGAVAIQKIEGKWEKLGYFSSNLRELDSPEDCYIGCIGSHKETMEFWKKHPSAYAHATSKQQPVVDVMKTFDEWVRSFKARDKRVTPVAAPAAFDFSFLYWYLNYALEDGSVLKHRCLDLKSFIMSKLKLEYWDINKSKFPKHWFNDSLEHNHIALDDAKEQAHIFMEAYDEVM